MQDSLGKGSSFFEIRNVHALKEVQPIHVLCIRVWASNIISVEIGTLIQTLFVGMSRFRIFDVS